MPGSHHSRYRFNPSGTRFKLSGISARLSLSFRMLPVTTHEANRRSPAVADPLLLPSIKGESVPSPLLLRTHNFSSRSELFNLCASAVTVRRQSVSLRRTSSAISPSFVPQGPSAAPALVMHRALLGNLYSSFSPFISTTSNFAASPTTIVLKVFRRLSPRSETPSASFGEQISAGQMESSSNAQETGTGRGKEASNSGQGSGVDLASITRGSWKGSDVTQPEIDWLYRSRRIPAQVSCRLPRGEVEPVPEPGEFVVFLAHFERGFGLPASDFFRQFLDFYQLQPHHLPSNAIFYLSCYVSFMEGYIGLLPTKEDFARFFCLRINSVQGKNIPKPKPPVQCGSCIIGSRKGSPFFKFSGLESCRAWQETFFYVRNKGATDFINLPAYNPGTPTKANWSYNPGNNHIETNRIVRFMEQLVKDTNICSDDIIRAFISRRVLPLQRRSHKISQMCGPRDPTKITGLPLSKEDVVLKARQICQTDMPMDWEWAFLPLSSTNPPTPDAKERFPRISAKERGPCRKRNLDEVDPDPYVHWTQLKMGGTHALRPGKFSTKDSGSNDEVTVLEAEVGHEFLEKLTSQGKKNKAPAPEAGSSHAPPAKRARQEIGGKVVTKKHYRKRELPVASGPALKLTKSATGIRPESSEEAAQASPPPQASPASSGADKTPASPLGGQHKCEARGPEPSDHRAEEENISPPEAQDTGTSNIGADTEAAGRAEPWVPLAPKKKKKKTPASSPSKTVPDSSAPASSAPAKDAPEAPAPPKITPTPLMSTGASILVDSVGPPRAEVCRTAASFP
ncbi:hypothetical protein QYE76_003264 [Lolium multiflorum]|uniref:Transposase (putative) gypsy type domain-containing protein n=1 Tax=Lolium multiflorum TaxID=4521 RepID=A0AAD8RPU6_LOLMU|nr:hypothetical protein QYE76_003264 [Lolium multiflorum]